MGEEKVRRLSRTRRLESGLRCIYCAGSERATTFDHMPPRAVFLAKQRPGGLEFPSCQGCNSGTKAADLVVALMSRIYPDATTPQGQADVKKYLDGVANNVPGLLTELLGSDQWRTSAQRRTPLGQHAVYCGGPLVSSNMERFAAKFGFAMHYEVTGKIIGTGGGVAARWYSNADALEGTFPSDAWSMLGAPATLSQGKFNVADQFEYAWVTGEDGRIGMFLGTFRQSFAVLAFTSVDARAVFEQPEVPIDVWRPGSFK